MVQFNIEIVSDTVCPWCYVGKKRLEAAIALYKEANPNSDDTFSLNWKPYYLNPDATKVGIDKQEYYLSKFGPQRTRMIQERLSEIGREYGINFKYGGRTGNSRDSHRLIQLGKSKSSEMQTRVIEELFASYFEKEQDITSHDVLLNAAVSAGLDEKEAKSWLQDDMGGKAVDEEVVWAKKSGITGVPNYTIDGKYRVQGAEDPSAFLSVFNHIKKDKS